MSRCILFKNNVKCLTENDITQLLNDGNRSGRQIFLKVKMNNLIFPPVNLIDLCKIMKCLNLKMSTIQRKVSNQ